MLKPLIALLAACSLLASAPHANHTEAGWDHFYNLEFEEAKQEFAKALAADPSDIDSRNHIAQAIMFGLMLRTGALESELVTGTNPFLRRPKLEPTDAERRAFQEQVETAIEMAKDRIAANPKDKDAWYALGVSYGLRSNYNFLVRKAYMDALRDATSARKAHDRVLQLDPGYVDAMLVQGVHEYVVGSLPLTYRMLGFLIGFRGDKQNGIRILQKVARQGHKNRVDAEVLLAAIYRRERKPKEAIPLLEDMIRRFPRNYLLRFELAQMYADAIDKDNALRVIAEIERLKRSGAPGYDRLPVEKVYFARGVVQFWYREFDQAIDNLERVTSRASEVDLNTAVTAWLRLGQTYDLTGQRAKAIKAYRAAIALAPQSDQGREARSYLNAPYKRKS